MPNPNEEICDCGCGRTYDDIIDEAMAAELKEQFEELKQLARDERFGKTYSSEEILELIKKEFKDGKS